MMNWLLWLIFLPFIYSLFFSKFITKASWEHYLWLFWLFLLLWGWRRTFSRWAFGDEDYYVRAAHAVGSGGDYQLAERSIVLPETDEDDEEGNEDDEEDDDYDDDNEDLDEDPEDEDEESE